LGEALDNQTKSATNETSSVVTQQYLETYLNENLAAIKEEVLLQAKQSSELALRDGIKNKVDTYLAETLKNYQDNGMLNFDSMITETIKRQLNLYNTTKENIIEVQEDLAVGLNRSQVEAIVRNALVRYDADKTGMFDFALETSGGSVVSTRCTQSYVERSGSYTLFNGWLNLGWFSPLAMSTTSPRNAIQPGVQPGQCWAFKGQEGRLLISLSSPMIPRRFSIEHIPRSLSPTGRIDSAPNGFVVYGLMAEFDKEPTKLGEYDYDAINGEPLQIFDIEMTEEKSKNFKLIEVEIKSNHGHPEYTCLYRFRVHGLL
jgi:SUN domain-containing protein 1/2